MKSYITIYFRAKDFLAVGIEILRDYKFSTVSVTMLTFFVSFFDNSNDRSNINFPVARKRRKKTSQIPEPGSEINRFPVKGRCAKISSNCNRQIINKPLLPLP